MSVSACMSMYVLHVPTHQYMHADYVTVAILQDFLPRPSNVFLPTPNVQLLPRYQK